MPNRIIRDAILSSEKMALLGWPEEVFYRRLMSIVDDYGRYEANPQLLRSRCYPLQTDAVRVTDISRWMAACQTAGLILCYAVQGKQYLEVSNFGQQQRSASKYPNPPSIDIACNHLLADEHLGVSVFGVVSEGECGYVAAAPSPIPRKAKTSKTGLPKDFGISDRVTAWAAENGFKRLPEHLDAFKRKATAKGYAYASWDDAFMEAIREDWAKLRGRTANGSAPPATHESADELESRAAVEKMGCEKGIGPWDVLIEQWANYKIRVLRAPHIKGFDLSQLGAMAEKRQREEA